MTRTVLVLSEACHPAHTSMLEGLRHILEHSCVPFPFLLDFRLPLSFPHLHGGVFGFLPVLYVLCFSVFLWGALAFLPFPTTRMCNVHTRHVFLHPIYHFRVSSPPCQHSYKFQYI